MRVKFCKKAGKGDILHLNDGMPIAIRGQRLWVDFMKMKWLRWNPTKHSRREKFSVISFLVFVTI